ncbi:MAG: M24 family metallopeptidase, partial [Myxococcales bacterium]|nr:M24 family metallopeptidase [Myxococcales bacterium]
GIRTVKAGSRLGDIGFAIQSFAEREGCSVVRDLGGHGIGREMHQEPHVPHFGKPGSGLRLKAGMAITIEPMVNLGTHEIVQLDDGWTIVTADGRLSAQFEHTIVVTDTGAEIMTLEP